MKLHWFKILPLALILSISPVLAEDAHDHDAPAGEEKHQHEEGHHGAHFNIEKPATVEAAWTMLDDGAATARTALETDDSNALHETGEKLTAAIAALQEHPDAVAEANREKLTSALGQLKKAIDRLHHAAEDNDKAGATEALDLIDSLGPLTKSLYEVNKAP